MDSTSSSAVVEEQIAQPDSPSAASATEGTPIVAPTADGASPAPEPSTASAPVGEDLSPLERLRIEHERVLREVEVLREGRTRAAELVVEIDQHDNAHKLAKADALKAKTARELAKDSLRALVCGDVQVQIDMNAKDDGSHAPGPAAHESPVSQRVEHRAVAGTYGAWQFDLTARDLEQVENMKLLQTEPELSARRVKGIEILGGKAYLPLESHYYGDGSGYMNAWELVEPEVWDSLYAEQYGSAVRDLIEESPDLTARRKTGGQYSGITVKTGRRKLVVAPDCTAVRLIFTQVTGNPGVAEYEAKALLPTTGNTAEVLSFPVGKLAERMKKRLGEYPVQSNGFHEAMIAALAGDLRVDDFEVANAAKEDDAFDVYLGPMGGAGSVEIVRLLKSDEVLFQ